LFKRIAAEFMPGPLTVILPKKDIIPDTVTAGLDSVAIRIPVNATAHKLIRTSGKPIAAPSANLSGKPSPTTAEHVIGDMMGRVDAIISGTDSEVGLESTVIKLTGENSLIICRPGAITKEMLEELCDNVTIDPAVLYKFDGKPISPGMKYRHYAPSAPVTILLGNENMIMDYLADKKDFGLLCYDDDSKLLKYPNSLSFGKSDDLEAQAHLLFDRLRSFDDNKSVKQIFARMPSQEGIGLAVYNRLIKAAGFSIITLVSQ
jgi:L-threonylcarbamoyladenylate synthase